MFQSALDGFENPRKVSLTACLISKKTDPYQEYAQVLEGHYADHRDWQSTLEISKWKPNHVSWFAGVGSAQAENEWWLLRNELDNGSVQNHLVMISKTGNSEGPWQIIDFVNSLNALMIRNNLVSTSSNIDPIEYMRQLNDLLENEGGQE